MMNEKDLENFRKETENAKKEGKEKWPNTKYKSDGEFKRLI